MNITLEQAKEITPIVKRLAKSRIALDAAANELEAALGQYFAVTRGTEVLADFDEDDLEEELDAEYVQQWVADLEEED